MSEVFVTSRLQALEIQLAGARLMIEQGEYARQLHSNPAFKKLIVDEFMTNESARYAHASADPSLNATQRADSLLIAQSAGRLKHWLHLKTQQGFQAEDTVVELEEAIAQERAEMAGGSVGGRTTVNIQDDENDGSL